MRNYYSTRKINEAEKLNWIAEYDKFINQFINLAGNTFVDDTLVVRYLGNPPIVIEHDDRVDEFEFFEIDKPGVVRKITTTLIFVKTKNRLGNILYKGEHVDFHTVGFHDEGTFNGRFTARFHSRSSKEIFTSFISYIDECLRALHLEEEFKSEQKGI